MLKRCGYVDLTLLIEGIGQYLKHREVYREERFQFSELRVDPKKVNYQEFEARRIIFCDGPWLKNNRFFSWLPLNPVKGELLEVTLAEPLDFIVNRGVFILPIMEKICKVGATFDNRNPDWLVTDQAKEYLIQQVEKLLRIPFTINKQLAGVRPASLDRRPLIGQHPEYEPLAVFNGLGTKGVSLAPYLIQGFYEFLEQGKPLIPEVAISRYFSLYYSKI